jgi:hypothetical protein
MYAVPPPFRYKLMLSVDNDQGVQMGYAGGTFVAHGNGREGDEGNSGTISSHVRRMFYPLSSG